MKLKELRELLNPDYLNENDDVVIGLYDDEYCVQSSYSNIDYIWDGFDWDDGKIFICSKDQLLKKEINEKSKKNK